MATTKIYHPLFRPIVRPLVLLLDNYSCVCCGRHSFSNHVHHNADDADRVVFSTLHTVCESCHLKVERGTFKIQNHTNKSVNLTPEKLLFLEKQMNEYFEY